MRRFFFFPICLFSPVPAWALRVMTDDRVIASQEARFMEGASFIMMLIGLVMFIGMGLVQWGLPHFSYMILRRHMPKLGVIRTVPIVIAATLLLWYVLSQMVFERHGSLNENLIYIGATLCGYLYPLIPVLALRWLRRNRPALKPAIHYGIAGSIFAVLSLIVWNILRLLTAGSF